MPGCHGVQVVVLRARHHLSDGEHSASVDVRCAEDRRFGHRVLTDQGKECDLGGEAAASKADDRRAARHGPTSRLGTDVSLGGYPSWSFR